MNPISPCTKERSFAKVRGGILPAFIAHSYLRGSLERSCIMDSYIVSFLTRYYDNIKSHLCKIWIDYTSVVRIIGLPFFTHKKVKCRSNRCDKFICTISFIARVVSISDIFCMLCSIYGFWIDTTSREPFIDHTEIIIAIITISCMMIFSS